jgi:hypothetical protein
VDKGLAKEFYMEKCSGEMVIEIEGVKKRL